MTTKFDPSFVSLTPLGSSWTFCLKIYLLLGISFFIIDALHIN